MKFQILHESSGRMRVRMHQKRMTLRQADILEAYLQSVCGISRAVVHERTSCAIINYTLPRGEVISRISSFSYAAAEHLAPEHSGRALNRTYEEKPRVCWCCQVKLNVLTALKYVCRTDKNWD